MPLHHPATLVATCGGIGLLPRAPGTWGSLAALPVGVALLLVGGPVALAAAALVVLVAGAVATDRLLAAGADEDPSYVVADEVGGQWLALLPATFDLATCTAAFLLFRAFDIAKPWPIGWIDRRCGGGTGAMLDDAVAGLAAALVLFGVLRWPG
ncbi:MAG: phosphatidylglycerophosphatase A [Alphaproteobacteria bacterium]|nr:phosphatidylglycerophosphatase A [Alphaproteobacteria bacterium]